MLNIWGRKTSSNVQALMWCVGELGLDYLRFDVGHRYGGTDGEAFYQLNPNRTVPVLQDGDNPPLWETGAILRYLASRYANEAFWPGDLLARTEVDRWAEWSKQNIALGFTAPVFWRVVRTPAAERDPQAIAAAVTTLEQKLAIAEARLAGSRYLVGDTFTLADIQFGHVLYRYFAIDITRRPLPHLAAYYARLTARPAFRQHVMVSYDELKV
ncbi:TPA: glutathione S-transferase family protein [Klebsiella pneumoniae]|uniref:glutathione S-transferase family protein n=1 Tax=Klebsiella pneumoniae complex TaxID=3390273 RepID=UPI001E5DBA88|nr:glutathione S-transferase family protein [Klebsiella pneumoniae]HDU5414786.1 glutathione S-transferase family protein [Klebsiella pneumoniae subsp. pneumoniae]MCD9441467.1 glutathione S-transferase family protein [Klebsiella pneumoniae]MCP6323009.1 glutathione S-transferase family protein [Klebsiella pneumoniae]MDZ2558981.1 glutathione S-transferase family protein [Klebsiella pneumoniae]WEU02643.1 glutathione S-transferase family protein [Klebsiella pneumoniae]